jgi:hypothetical protein
MTLSRDAMPLFDSSPTQPKITASNLSISFGAPPAPPVLPPTPAP